MSRSKTVLRAAVAATALAAAALTVPQAVAADEPDVQVSNNARDARRPLSLLGLA
ncbi:hypothetical protein ACQUSR_28045 [Streptomyces sp. P1-3]|uniref:hypothetical protein n=1 Tax=Streptomyces sp. P1-3 TaxID=3421658 RepID=UPI003D35D526